MHAIFLNRTHRASTRSASDLWMPLGHSLESTTEESRPMLEQAPQKTGLFVDRVEIPRLLDRGKASAACPEEWFDSRQAPEISGGPDH